VDEKKVDTILKNLGIDSVDTQDLISGEVRSHLESKNIDAEIASIRWNTVLLSADARNAHLLGWEKDSLSARITAVTGAKYRIKVRTTR